MPDLGRVEERLRSDSSIAMLVNNAGATMRSAFVGTPADDVAHGVADANPLQRALRDIAAIASHHGLDWDTSGELFGSFAFGIDPTDPIAS